MNKPPIDILIVDDSNIILERLADLLGESDLGINLFCVNYAVDGIQELEKRSPRILILDINLPGMSGIEMLRKVREMMHVQPIIIMLTNNAFSCYQSECINMGADYFLDKAKDFQRIPAIIASAKEMSIAS
jgi:two-component system chemotaxis response regulator CheY